MFSAFPIITYLGERTSARLMENVAMDVYYFSNSAGSSIKIFRNRNGMRQADVKYNVTETNAQVDLKVFGNTIKTAGVRARILIHIETKDDIGSYDVVVTNEINSTVRSMEIIAKGPPGVSYNVTVDNIQQTTARVSWQQGYHGGFPQTFLIQLSTDMEQWENVETVYGGTDESEDFKQKVLTDLSHSTAYFVRIYAFNREGNGPFSQYKNFTTRSIIGSDTQSSSVGGIVGGVVSAMIVIALIVVLVVLLRRKAITKDGIRTRLQAIFRKSPHEGQQTQPTEMDNVAVNDLYEQTKPNDTNKSNINVNKINLYEKLERTTSTENTNAYDTIKVEKEKTADSKVEYENLPKKTCTTDAFKSEIAEKLATGKTRIYENLKPGVKIAKKK
ncbi:uncharacterized protein LOC132723012 [Ruditapes philippinarum]|uniref:uncharacterized protein LOC132723012 n=1 Tax=Ruditapes philippinarum TaxID=129788 RepID=UPI00295A8BE5|nr:uncharacterized protein LOC132723012 [Ruditapes philippinarum]